MSLKTPNQSPDSFPLATRNPPPPPQHSLTIIHYFAHGRAISRPSAHPSSSSSFKTLNNLRDSGNGKNRRIRMINDPKTIKHKTKPPERKERIAAALDGFIPCSHRRRNSKPDPLLLPQH
jgi:hypothetical protein